MNVIGYYWFPTPHSGCISGTVIWWVHWCSWSIGSSTRRSRFSPTWGLCSMDFWWLNLSLRNLQPANLLLNFIFLCQTSSISLDTGSSSLWGSGEWWMFLAAQSMAVGTVMVRWVSKFSDPVMATGWVCPWKISSLTV